MPKTSSCHPDERLGPLSRLDRIIKTTEPDRIVTALAERRRRLPIPPLLEARLRGIMIEDGAAFYERLTGKIAIEALTPSSLIFSQDFRTPRLALWLGRALSVGGGAGRPRRAGPLIGVIAIAIRLDSRGPVLFVQERVGRAGRRFLLLKFRHDVVTEADTGMGAGQCRPDHAGRALAPAVPARRAAPVRERACGDMDLVGPRPHPFSNFSLFVTVLRNSPECGEQIPYYSIRSMARPGITGWAQVRYRYANNLEEEIEKMRYDLYYVKHRSFWLDLRILADTVKTVLGGRESLEAAPAPQATAAVPRALQVARGRNEAGVPRHPGLPRVRKGPRPARGREEGARGAGRRAALHGMRPRLPVVSGVPRFVDSAAYASSFGRQWHWFRKVQIDSISRTDESERMLAATTGWSAEDYRGQLVLDAGVGAGRFAEIASRQGGRGGGRGPEPGHRCGVPEHRQPGPMSTSCRPTFRHAFPGGHVRHGVFRGGAAPHAGSAAAFARVARGAPGGALAVYLYARYGPSHRFSDMIRVLTTRLPFAVLRALSAPWRCRSTTCIECRCREGIAVVSPFP